MEARVEWCEFFSFPIPDVPLRSTPGYLLGVPPALEVEAFPEAGAIRFSG
jgi:hypothetical protein